ncbi:MAG: beta-ribofuranosylaminobenzene 5-phosphate synthase [Hyphomicrobiales bacterium]
MSQAAQRPASVTVVVPARLHLGFLDLNGGLGRRFGGIGLAISDLVTSDLVTSDRAIGDLKTAVTVRRASHGGATGADAERALRHTHVMQQHLGFDDPLHVSVDATVPPHAGLGSGTSIALAIAAAVRTLHAMPLDTEADAVRLGRGARSGLGVGLFRDGGFAVDGGRGPATGVAPIIARLPFPDQWRVLLLLDSARQGSHGNDEIEAFAALPEFPEAVAAHLCRLVVMKALPALAEHDLAAFGGAIAELQQRLGDYFSPRQGGSRFTSPQVAGCLDVLKREGALGIGQSSWGPTGFAFAPSQAEADRLVGIARGHASEGLDIRVCKGLNRGAEITTVVDAHKK